jgi:hypothetical protein
LSQGQYSQLSRSKKITAGPALRGEFPYGRTALGTSPGFELILRDQLSELSIPIAKCFCSDYFFHSEALVGWGREGTG